MREGPLLFLLGAGASVDAGIKHAEAMTADIEKKILSDNDFKDFCALYNYLKSSIIYQRGLEGAFDDQVVTIEELLDVLGEINQKHQNKLYPFIGGWNIHLLKVAGDEFEKVSNFDAQIRDQLFQWINISNYDNSSYFQGFKGLVSDIGSAVRVFTLNYDICVEKALDNSDFHIELGFNDDRQWEASKFDSNVNSDVELYLYKLHGSIDWIRDQDNRGVLKVCDNPQQKNPELIFGTTAKLSSIDPYLFYVHELRKYSLNKALRLIVVIGYSFSDDYINSLIGQAVTRNGYLKVLVIAPISKEKKDIIDDTITDERERISQRLDVAKYRIIYENMTAKEFFRKKGNMKLSYFAEKSSASDNDPFWHSRADKKVVYVAFAIEDERARDFLEGQYLITVSPLEYVDMSVKDVYDSKWKAKARRRIKRSDGVIVLISKNSLTSSYQKWEIACAKKEGKKVLGIRVYEGDRTKVAEVKTVAWVWPAIGTFINSL